MRATSRKLIQLPLFVSIVNAVGESPYLGKSAGRIHVNSFVPIQNDISNNIERAIDESERPIENVASKYVNQVFDGPEKLLALLQNDYYRTQMAVGDPIRSKRIKRSWRDTAGGLE